MGASRLPSRLRSLAVLTAATLALASLATPAATPAGAADATGCSGSATSFTDDGTLLDTASAPGARGTQADPFHLDLKGTVAWEGKTVTVVKNGRYRVTVQSFTVASGKVGNADGKKAWAGTEDVGERLGTIPLLGPLLKNVNPTLTMKVDYAVSSKRAACNGTVYVKIGDDPTFSPLWFLAVVLLIVALALLFWPGVFFGQTRGGGIPTITPPTGAGAIPPPTRAGHITPPTGARR